MVFPRASMRRTARLINQPSRVIRKRPLQQTQRRAYSSGDAHGSTQASSDLPWAITAVAVTVPAVTYILWPKPKNNHGHGGHDEHGDNEEHVEHSESGKEAEDGDGGDAQDEHAEGDESSESSEAGEDGGVAEQGGADESSGTAQDIESDEKSSSEGEQEQDTPESSDDDQSATVSDVDEATRGHGEAQFKGPTKDGPPSDDRTSYSDSKGFKKKRIESNYGKPQGSFEGEDADSDGKTDKAAAAKPAGSQTAMSGKQEGLSNTDTKHSTDILSDPTKSKKPEGQPETAKLKGTVDPKGRME